jgi:peroxiredoxin
MKKRKFLNLVAVIQNMRIILRILPLILIISCSKGKKVEVSGVVMNAEKGKIFLDQQGIGEIRQIDSSKINMDGRFKLKDRIPHPVFYNLHLGDQQIIPLLLNPGDHAEIHADAERFSSDYSITGSVESQKIQELNRTLARTRQSLDSLRRLNAASSGADPEFESGINESYQNILRNQRNYSIEFVLDHHTSMVAIYALYQKINDRDFVLNENRDIQLLKITADALDTIYPESEHVKSLKVNAALLEEELYNQQLSDLVSRSESTTPDIRLPDPNGDTISLSSLKGKVVLLSFWASWNEESVSRNAQLKNLYQKYQARGFEIFQVSLDSEPEPWMRAIQFDELPWINVSDLSYPDSYTAKIYNIQELPTSYLINREGQIVLKNNNINTLNIMIPNFLD